MLRILNLASRAERRIMSLDKLQRLYTIIFPDKNPQAWHCYDPG